MGEHDSASVSRRALLAGAGGVAGAAAFGGVATPAGGAPVDDRGDLSPENGGPPAVSFPAPSGGLPPLADAPGVHYVSFPQYAFQPRLSADGKTVSAAGSYCTAGAGGFLIAPVDLEAGVQVVELTANVCNSSTTSVVLQLESHPLANSGGATVASVSTPVGAASTIQTNVASASHTISSSDSYDLIIFTQSSGAVRIYSARIGSVPRGYGFVPVTPTRVYDSRAGNPPLGVTKGQLSNGTRVINLLNGLSLPVAPKGVLTNLTVVNTSASGFISLFKNGSTWPGTSSINWFTANEIVANTAYTDVDTSGNAIAKVPANSSTDFFIDVVGYYP